MPQILVDNGQQPSHEKVNAMKTNGGMQTLVWLLNEQDTHTEELRAEENRLGNNDTTMGETKVKGQGWKNIYKYN